jgi:hypothetical protein
MITHFQPHPKMEHKVHVTSVASDNFFPLTKSFTIHHIYYMVVKQA